jgi:hypothetical protein
MRLVLGFLILVSMPGEVWARQAACTVVATVERALLPQPWKPLVSGSPYLAAPLGVPERHLSADAFVAHMGLLHHVPILSVETDDGARRIVLMVTFGPGWREAAARPQRKADEWLTPVLWMEPILSAPRAEDSFALLVVGGPRVQVPFGSSRADLLRGVEATLHPDPTAPDGPDLLDGLLQAASWFGSPQIGDSILQFGFVAQKPWDKTRASRLRSILISQGIRLFTLGGAYFMQGTCSELWDCGTWESPFTHLCRDTGGGSEEIGYLGPKGHDEMLWESRSAAKALYDLATFVYVLRLPRTDPRLKIYLTTPTLTGPLLHYPSPLPVCPPPAAAQPVKGKKK